MRRAWRAASSPTLVFAARVRAAGAATCWSGPCEHAAQDLDIRYLGFIAAQPAAGRQRGAGDRSRAGVLLAYVVRREPNRYVTRARQSGDDGLCDSRDRARSRHPGAAHRCSTTSLQSLLRRWFGDGAPTLLLQGTLLAVLLAYLARFLAVGFNPIESGLQRITSSIDEAAISLGVAGTQLLRKVHVPLLRTSLATAATLVFVDVMKEMPITLIIAAARLGHARDSRVRDDLRRRVGARGACRRSPSCSWDSFPPRC